MSENLSPSSIRIINIIAASLDGKIAHFSREGDAERLAAGFTNPADQRLLVEEMKKADAIILGAETLRARKKLLLQETSSGRYPVHFILSTRGLEAELGMWQQHEVSRIIVTPKPHAKNPHLPGHNLENLVAASNPVAAIYSRLAELGCRRALLFGGGEINSLFYAAGKVDELKLTLCPVLVGNPGAPSFIKSALPTPQHLTLIDSRIEDGYVFLHYQVVK
jgi:5-amino-6-(5-phosphoribosylamino)uracil reductase